LRKHHISFHCTRQKKGTIGITCWTFKFFTIHDNGFIHSAKENLDKVTKAAIGENRNRLAFVVWEIFQFQFKIWSVHNLVSLITSAYTYREGVVTPTDPKGKEGEMLFSRALGGL
jgi:hypothetical protein